MIEWATFSYLGDRTLRCRIFGCRRLPYIVPSRYQLASGIFVPPSLARVFGPQLDTLASLPIRYCTRCGAFDVDWSLLTVPGPLGAADVTQQGDATT